MVALVVVSPLAGVASFAGTASAAPGDVLYRVNAGGSTVTAPDGGPDWVSPGDATGLSVSGSAQTYSTTDSITLDDSVPDGTPSTVFQTERYGDQSWSFDVTAGTTYEVRLAFAEIFATSDSAREFDVSVEGQQVLDDYDIHADVGHDTGTVVTTEVTPSDDTLEVDFTTEVDNAKVSAVEIVEASPEPGVLDGPSGVDFGTVVAGNSATETVTLSNEGESGDESITVSGVSLTGADSDEFTTDFSGSTTLAPGETLDVSVTFTPSDAQPKSATLEVAHDATNTASPLTVNLSGEGASDVPVGFGSSQLDLSSVSVDSINNPTSLQFGPDGRLYVSQQDGTIYAFDIQRNGVNDYEATSAETITTIKNDVPNHNDDGEYNAQNIRQVTGLTVAGTASQPVLYVSSSDWRIETGNTNPPSQSLDTNSGVVSKLTETESGWDHTMLVRGLPRSEENHAPNGLALDEQNDVLYLAEGGHTNMGTPSNFFSNIPEYAYSGAILSIDLSEIESMPEKDAANTDVPYKYDLPTLAPGQTTTDGPFGGLDGDNMAVLEQDSPVQIHSSGWRNPYDVHLTEDGQLYSVDNGPNGGLGGPPTQACEAAAQNSGDTYDDNLHYISEEGYYAGHPNPVRGNPDYIPGAVHDGYDGTGECEYLVPGQEDGALATFGASTNGLTEYTASNFGGAMQGDLLTSSFDGNVYRIQLDAEGDGLTENPTPLLSSGGTLDVTAQGDSGPFPGTVWSAERTDNAIQVFEPADYDGDASTQCDPSDPAGDADGDGYTNGDEQAVGTDPCSAGSVPADYDDDDNPDQLDDDDDNDGLSDSEDPFALDPDNGKSTELPVELTFNPSETYPTTIPSATGGTDGLGFTGLMSNGQDPYSDQYTPSNVFAGGQAQILSVDAVPQGDAYQDQNDQQYAFQFGADTSDVSQPFTVHTTVAGFPEDPEVAQSAGMFIGTGDQDNYLKFVVSAAGGSGGVQLATENGGTFTDVATQTDSSVTGPDTATDLFLTVDPTTDPSPDNGVDEYEVTATYTVDDGQEQTVGTAAAPAAWFTDSDQGLAVGVISTSNFASSAFPAAWEQLSVQYAEGIPVADAGAAQTVDEGTTVELDASGSSGDSLTYSWTQTGGPSVTLSDASAAGPTFTAPDVDAETTLTFEVAVSDGTTTATDTVNVTVQNTDAGEVVFAVNAGGDSYTASDGTVYAADTNFTGGSTLATGSAGTPSNPDIGDTDDDTLYQTERYGDPFGYAVGVDNGTYQVTLQFAEIYQGVSSNDAPTGDDGNVGDRVFNASVEGEQVLTNYDLFADVGPLNATETTTTVEVTDGELNVDFAASADNAKVSAIVVRAVDTPSGPAPTTNASVTVTPASGLDASTYASGSFTVENTGETNLSSVTIDLSESVVPDAVFDPDGTAGDQTAKGLVVDSGASQTGVASTAAADVFSQPHDGDPDDGYDALTLTFDDFQPGETVTFSTDIDPTTIKGAASTGGAGSVSGLELSGSAVTVTSPEGSVTNDLFTDGSQGGAESAVRASAPAAPTLGVENATLSPTDFPAHQAATVSNTTATLTVSGPAGATVDLLVVEGSTPPADGYDVDAYEIDSATSVTTETVTLDSSGTATVDVSLTESAPTAVQAAVNADGGTGTTSETVLLAVDDSAAEPPTDEPTAGDVVYRVNVGGGAIPVDGGVDWSADTSSSVSPYLATSPPSGGTIPGPQPYSVGSVDDSVPDGTPTAVFQTERYDPGASPEMAWQFPAEAGATYEVRLHFHDGYSGTSAVGDRVFDVSVEDQTIEGFDPIAQYGDNTAGTETFTVTPTDDTVDVVFGHVTENPQVNGIEVVKVADAPETPPTASVAVSPDTDVSASTYNAGSYQVTNTGDENVTTLTVDLSETLLPDMVFDPFATAGDNAGKEFTLDSGDVTVEDVSYQTPHNGVDDSAGFDTLEVTFSGFEPGETATFSIDNDPTSITSTPLGSQAAGPVSGLELVGSTVTVADGSNETAADTFSDGSGGGAQATVTTDTPPAPTIGVENVTLSSTTLSDRHTAATVGSATQTVTVSGPPNTTVTLLQIEASLDLSDVPDPYEVEAYEANKALQVTEYTTTTDASGQATVPVTLTDTSLDANEGGLNYFAAVVEDGTVTGATSNYVVLDYEENVPPTVDTLGDQTVTAGETLDLTVNASDADGDAPALSVEAPDFVSLADAGDGTGTLTAVPDDGDTGTYTVTVVADDGVTTTTETFSLTVEAAPDGPAAVGDFENAPTDPDDDGVYEDVNGDGNATSSDVTALFTSLGDPVVQGTPTAFDVNGDGNVTSADVTALFVEVTGGDA